jgi:hypothetical protein
MQLAPHSFDIGQPDGIFCVPRIQGSARRYRAGPVKPPKAVKHLFSEEFGCQACVTFCEMARGRNHFTGGDAPSRNQLSVTQCRCSADTACQALRPRNIASSIYFLLQSSPFLSMSSPDCRLFFRQHFSDPLLSLVPTEFKFHLLFINVHEHFAVLVQPEQSRR